MKKYLFAAALVVGFSVPAFAVETYYIMYDNSMKGCSVMTTKPSGLSIQNDGRIQIPGRGRCGHEVDEGVRRLVSRKVVNVAAAFGRRPHLSSRRFSYEEISGRRGSDRGLRHSRLG